MTSPTKDKAVWHQPWVHAGHNFPALWRTLLPSEVLTWNLPTEAKANCRACPMIAEAGYRPDYRCCTYYPRVANFLLGFALDHEAGQAAVQQALAAGMLLPEGMHASPGAWRLSLLENEAGNYGRSTKVLCPMLDPASGHCRIHAQRNAVCATYFCHYENGDRGAEFWGQLQTLGSQLELALAQWALDQVGFSLAHYQAKLDALAPQIPGLAAQEGGWPREILGELWGVWFGRELELYRQAAQAVARHQGRLWDLASAWPIVEARTFESALDRLDGDGEDYLGSRAAEDEESEMAYDRRSTWLLLKSAYQVLAAPKGSQR